MIEPGLVRDTESKMYVKEIAYLFLILSFNDIRRLIFSIPSRVLDGIDQNESFRNLKEGVLTNVNPYVFLFGIILFLYVPFGQIKMLGFFFILYSINPFTDFVSEKAGRLQSNLWNAIMPPSKAQYGRSSERGSWVTFAFFLVLLIYVAWWLPSVTNFTKIDAAIKNNCFGLCLFDSGLLFEPTYWNNGNDKFRSHFLCWNWSYNDGYSDGPRR